MSPEIQLPASGAAATAPAPTVPTEQAALLLRHRGLLNSFYRGVFGGLPFESPLVLEPVAIPFRLLSAADLPCPPDAIRAATLARPIQAAEALLAGHSTYTEVCRNETGSDIVKTCIEVAPLSPELAKRLAQLGPHQPGVLMLRCHLHLLPSHYQRVLGDPIPEQERAPCWRWRCKVPAKFYATPDALPSGLDALPGPLKAVALCARYYLGTSGLVSSCSASVPVDVAALLYVQCGASASCG